MKRVIKFAALLVMLLSLCACGESGPQKPIAPRYNNEIISVYSTKSQVEKILGAPTREVDRTGAGKSINAYYLGSQNMIMYSNGNIFALKIMDDKIDFAGFKVGDSISKAKKNLDGKLNAMGENRYACCIVDGEAQDYNYVVVKGVNDTEAMLVLVHTEGDKITSITVAPDRGVDLSDYN